MSRRITGEEYRIKLPQTDSEKALNLAHDIRKFEIDLYWKRATYFWTFIAIALAGYVTVLGSKDIPYIEKGDALLTCACVGVVFSVAWYFVNRASKFWQENWEKHVDLLEDEVLGSLYKTVLSDEGLWTKDGNPRFWPLGAAYPFSVSKINQTLSLFVVALFLLLAVVTGVGHFEFGCDHLDWFATSVVGITVAFVIFLGNCWTEDGNRDTRAKLRTTKIVPEKGVSETSQPK